MSRQDLKSLLDEMLTDATTQQQKEVREARPVRPADRDTTPAPEPPSPSGFTDVEQFRLVHDAEVRKVLAAAARDDVLTMLSGASDGLRRKILTNLSRESVQWLQQNLEYFDEPTRALLAAGRKGVLDVANKLLREGKIALPAPEPKDEAGAPKQPRMDDDLERLGSIFTELLGLAQRADLHRLRARDARRERVDPRRRRGEVLAPGRAELAPQGLELAGQLVGGDGGLHAQPTDRSCRSAGGTRPDPRRARAP